MNPPIANIVTTVVKLNMQHLWKGHGITMRDKVKHERNMGFPQVLRYYLELN